jgi:nucleotide-binding universal stress UspA family protein
MLGGQKHLPFSQAHEISMYRHILIATDGSELANKALAQGLELARALKAQVTVLTVTGPFPMPGYGTIPAAALVEAYEAATTESAARTLSSATAAATKSGLACDTLHVRHGEPAEAIVGTGRDKACDLIVMTSHGYRGVKQMLLGSVAMKVLTQSKTPVLICR